MDAPSRWRFRPHSRAGLDGLARRRRVLVRRRRLRPHDHDGRRRLVHDDGRLRRTRGGRAGGRRAAEGEAALVGIGQRLEGTDSGGRRRGVLRRAEQNQLPGGQDARSARIAPPRSRAPRARERGPTRRATYFVMTLVPFRGGRRGRGQGYGDGQHRGPLPGCNPGATKLGSRAAENQRRAWRASVAIRSRRHRVIVDAARPRS